MLKTTYQHILQQLISINIKFKLFINCHYVIVINTGWDNFKLLTNYHKHINQLLTINGMENFTSVLNFIILIIRNLSLEING
jgi:hypothetical protein